MIADLQQQLGIDSSFFQQFLIFLFAYLWLSFFYFSPFLRLIQKREGQSDGLSEEAQKMEEEAGNLERRYQEAISATRRKAMGERDGLLSAARKQGSEEVAAARNQAKTKLDQARETAARNAASELSALKTQASPISKALVEKLMNTKVGL